MADRGHKADGALQTDAGTTSMPAPLLTFDGPTNDDNRAIYGFGSNPPDPNGDVGLHEYVAMVNQAFAVYSKHGRLLFGPAAIGTLWQGFAVEDCTGLSGDPIVLYDEISNRWILTQFTNRGPTYYNCVAVSKTDDPLGSYTRYAFSTGQNFPDYPKYGVMPKGLFITAREMSSSVNGIETGIGIYAINRHKLIRGTPNPAIVSFHLTGPPYLVGDGLLPADLDGKRKPPPHSPEYLVGSMDDGAFDGAPFDALNMFRLDVRWAHPDRASFNFVKHVPISEYDTIYPCAAPPSPIALAQDPATRDCLPQPGVTDRSQYLDFLVRQRPTWRLQYRNFGDHESLVTNQSVEARPGIAGVRWWELRNPKDAVLHQEGTWSPNDGVNRWMGSVALDKRGNMALGYSVVNATDVYPGIRYAGRLAGDPFGQLARGEAVMQAGSGSQLGTDSRWGDYTSMSVDPKDDCTFWYMNEYYPITGLAAWRTKIGAFRFPGCR